MGTVLVVDDQPLNRVIISRLLRSLSLEVVEAGDGEAGLQKYLQRGRAGISFVFLDLMMPVLDGFGAALSIRSVESQHGWLPVPIVAFTSEDVRRGSPMWQQCMHSGFNDVVPKPMDRRHATKLLLRWLPHLRQRHTQPGSPRRPHCSSSSSDDEAPGSHCSAPSPRSSPGLGGRSSSQALGSCGGLPGAGAGSSSSLASRDSTSPDTASLSPISPARQQP